MCWKVLHSNDVMCALLQCYGHTLSRSLAKPQTCSNACSARIQPEGQQQSSVWHMLGLHHCAVQSPMSHVALQKLMHGPRMQSAAAARGCCTHVSHCRGDARGIRSPTCVKLHYAWRHCHVFEM